eukprot:scaffold70449_cov54-Phaeocystis_antarctica.AAC.3
MGRSRRSSPSALHRSQLQAEVRRQCSAAVRGVPLVLPPVGFDQASAGTALLLEGVPEAMAWGRLVRRSRRALRTCCAEGGVDWPRWYNSKSKSVAVAAISFARSERPGGASSKRLVKRGGRRGLKTDVRFWRHITAYDIVARRKAAAARPPTTLTLSSWRLISEICRSITHTLTLTSQYGMTSP